VVEALGEDAHLVVGLDGNAGAVVAPGQAPGAVGQELDRPADVAGEERAEDDGWYRIWMAL